MNGIKSALHEKYPPSEPCTCRICTGYCKRPGWWTVDEAEAAIECGFALRMMLEVSPDRSFSVLSPAFRGNECNYALNILSDEGCTFLKDERCELYGTGLQPLECRYCHHDRQGKGKECHRELENEWNGPKAKRLIVKWGNITGFWRRQGLIVKER